MEAGDAPVSACPERPQWSRGLPGSSFLVSPQHGREPPGRQGSGMGSDLAQPPCGDIKGCGCLTPPLLLFARSLYGGVWVGHRSRTDVSWAVTVAELPYHFRLSSAPQLGRQTARRPVSGGAAAVHFPACGSRGFLRQGPPGFLPRAPAPSHSSCSGGSREPGRAGWLSGTCPQLRPAPRGPLLPHRSLRV